MTNKTDKLCMPTTSLSDYSIVLIELFEKNDFESLIASLNKLYGSYCENPHFKIYDDPNKTFENGLGFIGLPDLVKEFITSDNKVYYNFGEYIKNVKVDFVHLTPSIAILKFHIFLKDDFSKKIIEILDKRNMQYSKPPNSDNKMMKWILHHRTDMLKTTGALMEFKTSVNEDILEFLEEFNGFFYKVYENDFSIFPTIDIFHLDWPDDTEELNEWIMDNFAFLASINALTPPHDFFKHDDDLICNKELNLNEKYQNSIIISKNPKNVIYNNEFELLGLYRWINLKLDEFKELNSIIEDTVKKLNETNLGTMLKKSIVISEKFLPVEMLELEFKYVRVSLEDFDSVCWENVGFLSDIYENIKEKIDEIKFIKKTSNEKMDSILNLKNIQFNENVQNKMLSLTKENQTIQEQMLSLTEYNKKIQIMVMILSACVIIFTIIQVYLSYQTLINNNQTSLVAMIISWI